MSLPDGAVGEWVAQRRMSRVLPANAPLERTWGSRCAPMALEWSSRPAFACRQGKAPGCQSLHARTNAPGQNRPAFPLPTRRLRRLGDPAYLQWPWGNAQAVHGEQPPPRLASSRLPARATNRDKPDGQHPVCPRASCEDFTHAGVAHGRSETGAGLSASGQDGGAAEPSHPRCPTRSRTRAAKISAASCLPACLLRGL